MNRLSYFLLSVCLLLASGCVTVPTNEQEARSAATDWLALLDSGDFHQAYIDRPPRILAGSKEEDFLRSMRGRRAPLGKPIKRAFLKVSYSKTLAGAPDGNYRFMFFKTQFEYKADTIERVVVSGETGHWEVSGYSFR